MSAHHDAHGAAADHDGGAPHGTRKSYLIGFALSVLLTAVPFAIVMADGIVGPQTAAGICMVFAVVQILVHMVYFLHMNTKSENGWTMMALIFTVIVVVIALTGSLWVMYHMNANMMPGMGDMSGGM
ncbi:cytochrome o ubiquinol oxidase subunit IV [Sphingomonas corticis]|jgi:cytochrome o ubiquinol oxidase operon protein cyoD|uniref:Cytochrome bo(3) ubiquinol oxidase subunit 4 n=1 Tax=Sphingomonas corticis TaxID=2722791 RepID=A0ABX1CJN2_9SPHN|nr:cytochrome o ubiquinol oxidase subunit IV [Sphingomonas corticis]NJR78201.1 cytochrome o ubiquinol oxidase subunit IV [Sphingomonas corticis]